MSGDIPSELGNVVSIKHLDFRKYLYSIIVYVKEYCLILDVLNRSVM